MAGSRSKENSVLEKQRKKRRQAVIGAGFAVLALLFIVFAGSFFAAAGRGDPWDPFAFLRHSKQNPTLPTTPNLPPEPASSAAPGPGISSSVPAESSSVRPGAASSAEVFPTTVTEPATEPTTEEPTEPATEKPTEPTTEKPTEPATEEPTEPTTEEPTEPATEEPTEPTTEEPVFDPNELKDHLTAAVFAEEDLIGSQLVVVQGLEGSHCVLYFFEKDAASGWSLTGSVPVANGVLGRDGIKPERLPSDHATPAGYFALGPVYGSSSMAITDMDYTPIQAGDCWVTDPNSDYFNSFCHTGENSGAWNASFDLHARLDQFHYAVLIQYNLPYPDPMFGSAVFLNIQTEDETDGSVATREATLFALLQWLKPEADPHILIYQYEADHE